MCSHKSPRCTLAAVFVWLAAVVLFFSPSVFCGKTIAPVDCLECVFRPFATRSIENVHNHFVVDGVSQYLPYKWAIKKSFEEDGYMGWNPYTHNGCAGPENTMTSPGDLNNWLYAIFDFWTAWDLGIILQFFIAGCGMILLLRHYKFPLWAVLLGAVSFAFYSQFILWIYHKWVGALIWGPYLVWALIRYKRYLVNVPAVIFMALAWRTGHLQACTFAFILVACVWLAEIWKQDGKWPARQEIIRITISYFLTGCLGALLSLDVFVDTLPRMEGCKEMPFGWGINNLLTLGTLLFPNILGVPQTLDVAKTFSLDLFDVKYGGSIVFILAVLASFNVRAPRIAKFLFWGSLLIACTPMITYVYSRSTVVMALGMSWLAAWQLVDFTKSNYDNIIWKRVMYVMLLLTVGWLAASIAIALCRESLAVVLHNAMNGSSSDSFQRAGRVMWHELRVDKFLDQIVLWNWKNLIYVGSCLLGVFCCYKMKVGSKMNAAWASIVALLSFGELALFASAYVTYSEKQDGPYLYNAPAWLPEVKKHVKEGSVHTFNTAGDVDFLCNNTLSAFDIRLAYGYETFHPEYLKPLHPKEYDSKDYALAGISHILADSKWKRAQFPGWKLVMAAEDFDLFANPDYNGRYFVDGTTAIKADWRTCNRIQLSIPENATRLTVLESYHRGWEAYADGKELEIVPTERGGMEIKLPSSSESCRVLLEFHMPWRKWYYAIMAVTACALLIIIIRQRKYPLAS